MDFKRLLNIFHDYVDNDYTACGDSEYVRMALEAVASKEEIVALGFGWIYPEEC